MQWMLPVMKGWLDEMGRAENLVLRLGLRLSNLEVLGPEGARD